MFKVRNIIEKKFEDTEFWLEEHDGAILIKAKLSGADGFTAKQMCCIIAHIDEKGLLVYDGVEKALGFETIIGKIADLSCIRVRHSFEL